MKDLFYEVERDYQKMVARAKRLRARAKFVLGNLPELPEGITLRSSYAPVYARGWKSDEFNITALENPKYVMVEIEVEDDAFVLTSKTENRELLAEVMAIFKCILSDAQPSAKSQAILFDDYTWEPETIYYGLGEMGGYKVVIKLFAPWSPPGCKIEKITSKKKEYQLVCGQSEQ